RQVRRRAAWRAFRSKTGVGKQITEITEEEAIMAASSFVYVTYIKTSPQELWTALISPEFTQKYWFGIRQESEWKAGASWKMVFPDGRIADAGEVIECDPPKRLVLKWQNQFK